MELFREDGCLTDEGLDALIHNQLDELGRLEAAEHLSYCDRCLDRYTARLTGETLEQPPRGMSRPVLQTIWVRVMQNFYGRAAVAGVAALLALTIWGSGAFRLALSRGHSLEQTRPSSGATPPAPQMVEPDRPGHLYDKLFEAWGALFTTDETNTTR
ncbi:hypothetical protein [Faecalibacterium gallinarum]|uniref:Zinc-finger domain-containing protein n=1 Tax=Faecalibacterium gallinarum TaxID=2903556 RepID=A0AA37IXF2_9FIRM|nr:hypothetical protein [Faecalibacterium gallinarum]GJN63447.1 hypothetical protein JCM17207_00720 [Faecalibacterium gallinarum]